MVSVWALRRARSRSLFCSPDFCVHGSISILLKGGVLRGLVYPGREEKRAVCGVIGWLLCVSPARAVVVCRFVCNGIVMAVL